MASLNGVELKNFKITQNKYGESYSGTVYWSGKRLGFWCQDPIKAFEDNYEFPRTILMKPFYRWKSYLKGTTQYTKVTLDTMMADVAYYTKLEKTFKKQVSISHLNYLYNIHVLGTTEGLSQMQSINHIPREKEMDFKRQISIKYPDSTFKFDSYVYGDLDEFKKFFGTLEGMEEEMDKVTKMFGVSKEKKIDKVNISSSSDLNTYYDILNYFKMGDKVRILSVLGDKVEIQNNLNGKKSKIPRQYFSDYIKVIYELFFEE